MKNIGVREGRIREFPNEFISSECIFTIAGVNFFMNSFNTVLNWTACIGCQNSSAYFSPSYGECNKIPLG